VIPLYYYYCSYYLHGWFFCPCLSSVGWAGVDQSEDYGDDEEDEDSDFEEDEYEDDGKEPFDIPVTPLTSDAQ
jgi:hypothetical protein